MKLIISAATLRAHNAMRSKKDFRNELMAIHFLPGKIWSTDGRLYMWTDDATNNVKKSHSFIIERIPTSSKVQSAVIDTDNKICYFFSSLIFRQDQIYDESFLRDNRVSVCGATPADASRHNFEQAIPLKRGSVSNVALDSRMLQKLHTVARATGCRTKTLDFKFQKTGKDRVLVTMTNGQTSFFISLPPVR